MTPDIDRALREWPSLWAMPASGVGIGPAFPRRSGGGVTPPSPDAWLDELNDPWLDENGNPWTSV